MVNPSITYLQEDLLLSIEGLPTFVQKTKKTKLHLNFNNVLKMSYRTYYAAKEKYFKDIVHKLPDITINEKVALLFVFYAGDNGVKDLSNMVSVIDKFMSDFLVRTKILPEDNTKVITDVRYLFGGVTPKNQHINMYIFRAK